MNFIIPKFILKYRLILVIAFALTTVFLGWKALHIQLSFDSARVLPPNDPTMAAYDQYKRNFGADGNMLVVGFESPFLFDSTTLYQWGNLEKNLQKIEGVEYTLSILSMKLPQFNADGSLREWKTIESLYPIDSVGVAVRENPTLDGLIYNPTQKATMMVVSIGNEMVNSSRRDGLMEQIKEQITHFENNTKILTHVSGMPYIRHEHMQLVLHEMILFLILSLLVTILILYAFFRSFSVIIFSFVVLLIEVVWSLGILVLLGYKISILTGMLPSLIVVISIPNSIFIFNRYYFEFARSRQKGLSLVRTIQGLWTTLLLANVTTAIGFAVFRFTGSLMLIEFGTVAAISIMATFVLTMMLTPILLSYLPSPTGLRAVHLKAKRTHAFLNLIVHLVLNKRKMIYWCMAILTLAGLWGASKIIVTGYVVDDLPKDHPISIHMRFFEEKFGGVLPLEILIENKNGKAIAANGGALLYKIQALDKVMSNYPEYSNPLSIPEGIKFLYQHYRGGEPKYHVLPAPQELRKLSAGLHMNTSDNLLRSFIDSTGQVTRVSYRMKDIGSREMNRQLEIIRPKIDSLFPTNQYNVALTGMSMVFLKNNDYFLSNLMESLLIEILLIAVVGMILFRSIRIILFSKVPCLLPLLITAGIMGFAGVVFKSSTILIFTIAFGLASDGTIYFLTRYRHELKHTKALPQQAIATTIRETGLSMMYTALILFFGFAIFAASSFGGTRALGLLVSTTLFISMISNLILLPTILLSIDKRSKK